MAKKQAAETLGDRIRKRRNQLKVSQSFVARKIGVPDAYLSIWERGLRPPNVFRLAALAKALKCTTDYLVNGETE